MTERYPFLHRFVQFIALIAILISVLFPGAVAAAAMPIAVVLILLAGIPHGATDHLIFLQLNKPRFVENVALTRFYIFYVLLMAVYGLVWWLWPALALVLFMLLSVYHFGQSNWNYVPFARRGAAWMVYLLWGSFVLFTPILWHFATAAPIIGDILRSEVPVLTEGFRQMACVVLFVANLVLILGLRVQQRLSPRQMRDEIVHLILLGVVFVSTPLLIGFVLYFAGWHSLGSMADQIRFFQKRTTNYTWRTYLRQAAPLSAVALLGLGALYALQMLVGVQAHIGLLFIFISIVTLPHMILIDLLYGEWEMKPSVVIQNA
ncbi:MAG TPA: Brp/Blh family beta-carotene 15,15'-dioxygenase [Saprospiraceae bacterium]|nr:Brp/Blh family beta-carotene 15,15'-dioxygenase [Saprospiraceae bacterium]HMP25450.1 Brp/Blh family beta-carotene 15,15'-dioxygenase [Saprospiraceae bacterium]